VKLDPEAIALLEVVFEEIDPDEAVWWEIIDLVYHCRPKDLERLSEELTKKFRVISSRSIS